MIRFKSLGGTRAQLLTIYQACVRSVLEFAAPVFSSGLTKSQSQQIEMVQKRAFAIFLGREYSSYETALNTLEQERLSTCRTYLCYSFALKCSKSSKHASMFPLNNSAKHNTRNNKPFLEFKCNTSRCFNSPIPSLTRLLNKPPVPQILWCWWQETWKTEPFPLMFMVFFCYEWTMRFVMMHVNIFTI